MLLHVSVQRELENGGEREVGGGRWGVCEAVRLAFM